MLAIASSERDDRGDRSRRRGARPASSGSRLLADLLVALLAAGVAARMISRGVAAVGRRPAVAARALAHQLAAASIIRRSVRAARARVVGLGDRAHDDDPLARPRRAPPGVVVASRPPIANHGARRGARRVPDGVEADRRPALLRRRRVHRADGEVVDVRAARVVDLLDRVGGEPDDRAARRRPPARRRRACRPGRRARRRRRRASTRSGRSLRTNSAPASSQHARATSAWRSTSSSERVLLAQLEDVDARRPARAAARPRARRPPGRAPQTK